MILSNPTIEAQKIILPLNSVFEQVGKSSFLIKTGVRGAILEPFKSLSSLYDILIENQNTDFLNNLKSLQRMA